MIVYLAGCESAQDVLKGCKVRPWREIATLMSFYAIRKLKGDIAITDRFLLDSGAFSLFGGKGGTQRSKKNLVWEEYVDELAEFVVRKDIKRFFELDIDSLVGYEKVLELRTRLEKKTGRQCIPVWHKSRGKEKFLKMCESYPYVSIGGIVSREISQSDYKYFPYLISEAHKRKSMIHGLGFTNHSNLKNCHFDSVDSTSWSVAQRWSNIQFFNGCGISQHRYYDKRVRDMDGLVEHNFNEWVKYQQWCETHR